MFVAVCVCVCVCVREREGEREESTKECEFLNKLVSFSGSVCERGK